MEDNLELVCRPESSCTGLGIQHDRPADWGYAVMLFCLDLYRDETGTHRMIQPVGLLGQRLWIDAASVDGCTHGSNRFSRIRGRSFGVASEIFVTVTIHCYCLYLIAFSSP